MSATPLRAPARSWPVAWSYLTLLAGRRAAWVYVVSTCIFFMAAGHPWGFRGVAFLTTFMSGLPAILLLKLRATPGPLEQALPIGRVRSDLLWAGCSAAWAGIMLALAVGLTTALVAAGYGGPDGSSGWYPLLLFAVGLGYYMFSAAVMFASTKPLPLVILAAVASVPFLHPPARLVRLLAIRIAPSPAEALGLVGPAALWLAAGVTVLGLAASAPSWPPSSLVGQVRAALGRVPWSRPALPTRKPRTLPAGARRRPPPLSLVLWREIVLFRVRMAWLVACTLCIVLWLVPSMVGDSDVSAIGVYAYALVWSSTVWLTEKASRRGGSAPLPVGMAAQRLVRVAAGAVWLEAAVLVALAARAAGVGAWGGVGGSPGSAAGIAACALVLYLLGSVGPVLAREYGAGWMLGWFFFLGLAIPLGMHGKPHGILAPGSVLQVFFTPRPGPWLPAALLWGAVLAGLVWAAAAGGAAHEREGRWWRARAGRTA